MRHHLSMHTLFRQPLRWVSASADHFLGLLDQKLDRAL